MAITDGFWNAIKQADGTFDRTYNSEQIGEMFEGLVTDGVYEDVDEAMAVTASSGMTVQVGSGRITFPSGKWLKTTARENITLATSHVSLNRYSAIVVQCNYSTRTIRIIEKAGTPATNPVYPALTNTATIQEKCLAYVYVGARVTAITQTNITDTRLDSNVCGFVTGIIEQVDTSLLYDQWQSAYNECVTEMTSWEVEQKLLFDKWFSALTSELNVNTFIEKADYSEVVDSATGAIYMMNIPSSVDLGKDDVVFVYLNGIKLNESEYTIDFDKKIIDFTWGVKNGNEVDVRVLKSKIGQGVNSNDVLGLEVDFVNSTFTRLGKAEGLLAGTDFNKFPMYGGRRRCNVSDDGTITAYFGDVNYREDGSNGQVMVYQPKFYYMVVPVIYEQQEGSSGYHLRKADYYISARHNVGFKLHPAFYDENGNVVDYVLFSAYEGSIYDKSANAYLMNDEQIMNANEDMMCSISGTKPASGLTQTLSRQNVERMAKNRGQGWHSLNIQAVSANQLLMLIEYASFNLQTLINQGIVSIANNDSYNCSSLTGSTSGLGNSTGVATQTINEQGGTTTVETENGKVAVSYRGMENPWGNIHKFIDGINIYGNGQMGGGEAYICTDYNYAESKNDGNYEGTGFYLSNTSGYISAFGYSQKYDWLFVASECSGNAVNPVGDNLTVASDLNGYMCVINSGHWYYGLLAGAFMMRTTYAPTFRYRFVGGRMMYVPTATMPTETVINE